MAGDRYFDGSQATPVQRGPTLVSMDEETHSALYERVYTQIASAFSPTAIDTTTASGPNGSYLINETPCIHQIAGVVQWSRQYAAVPSGRSDFTFGPVTLVLERSGKIYRPTYRSFSEVRYRYIFTSDPTTITLNRAFNVFYHGSITEYIPGTETETHRLIEDEQIERWRGNIWAVSGRWIKKSDMPHEA